MVSVDHLLFGGIINEDHGHTTDPFAQDRPQKKQYAFAGQIYPDAGFLFCFIQCFVPLSDGV